MTAEIAWEHNILVVNFTAQLGFSELPAMLGDSANYVHPVSLFEGSNDIL